jgi:hypothetical protein
LLWWYKTIPENAVKLNYFNILSAKKAAWTFARGSYNKSRAEIHYMEELSWLIVSDESEVQIFGSQFKYEGGHLSGQWSNGEIFSFWALKGQGPSQPPLSPSNTLPNNIKLINPPSPPLPDINLSPIYHLLILK